jgi:hypothetical protein
MTEYINADDQHSLLLQGNGSRMLGPSGNPTVENLFNIISQLKEQEGLKFDIRARRT